MQLATALSHEEIAPKIFSISKELQVLALSAVVQSIQTQLQKIGEKDGRLLSSMMKTRYVCLISPVLRSACGLVCQRLELIEVRWILPS
jgi:tetrahydromethanopterin S-methyltransferase subunit F